MTITNAAFAAAFAPMMEVLQGGIARAATPADILEVIEPPRYALKQGDLYLATRQRGFVPQRRSSLFLRDLGAAREARALILREYGVAVRIVRIRRKGTKGIEAYRLRPDIRVSEKGDGLVGFDLSHPEAMELLAALTGGAERKGEA